MKYTRFCSAQTLIRHIEAPSKDQQATHVLLSVFKKPLAWLELQYDRETFLDSINAITIATTASPSQQLAWVFVIEGRLIYLEMPFEAGEWVRLGQYEEWQVRMEAGSSYAVLTHESLRWLKGRNDEREKERIVRFLKQAVFYPHYLEEPLVRQFAMLSRVKSLPFGKALNWKDQDGSCKLAVVYKGVVGIEYQWKRTLQLAEVTRGMFLANRYIRDEVEELDDLSLEPLGDASKTELPKFRFIGRAEETVLVIFNLRLISESPYNVNPDLRAHVKEQFQKYAGRLQEVIGFEQYNKLHRSKLSIKQELRRRKEKETIDLEVTQELQDIHSRLSPILMTYSSITPNHSSSITLPEPPRPFSHTVFTAISTPRLLRSRTNPTKSLSPKQATAVLVHNTWVQEMSKKKKNVKSFSTLRSLSTFHADRHKQHQLVQEELAQGNQPKFFVPNQFVKRKLKLKYQDLVAKMKNLDLTLSNKGTQEESVAERMRRLQSFVDSKRIVKLNTLRGKHKLLRDKVEY